MTDRLTSFRQGVVGLVINLGAFLVLKRSRGRTADTIITRSLLIAVSSPASYFQERVGGSCPGVNSSHESINTLGTTQIAPTILLRDSDFLSSAIGWSSDVRGLGVSVLVASSFVQEVEGGDCRSRSRIGVNECRRRAHMTKEGRIDEWEER